MSERRQIQPDTDTLSRQAVAASPERSVWVSANAGSGKTYVLATRVIRLLLAGTDPSRILCLTYTKTAAAEMKDRVFKRLGAWVTMPEADLREELEKLEGRTPDSGRLAFARCLFARALETPGGLKIQTIHAFCDALLHRFPLEANVPGHFEQLDDDMIAALIGEARTEMLSGIDAGRIADVAEAFRTVIELTGENGLDALLDEAVQNRSKLVAFLRHLNPARDRRAFYRTVFGFAEGDSRDTIVARALKILRANAPVMREVLDAAAGVSAKTGRAFAEGFLAALDADDAFAAFEELFYTKAGAPRSTGTLMKDKAVQQVAGFEAAHASAFEAMQEARDRIALLAQIDNTLAALTIVDRLLSGYESLKRRRGYLDFDDLIERTANLLARPDVGEWVRYKLDQGIDHILVDEAQDTSPRQWQVIRALSDEFFAGEGARQARRTLFAVGDEKQSIYSFQGADPVSFGETGEAVRRKARAVFGEEGFRDVPLETSFRSTQDVLSAVDKVFEFEANRAGVALSSGPIRHVSLRKDQPGRVEIWPLVKAERQEEPEDWTAPVDAPRPPAVIVAERIADTVSRWIREGDIIEGLGRPVTAGDILVLVRSRDSFIVTLSRALKDRGVQVAGADRLKMTDHIAVLDLLALARFVLQPADDLSLAALLRSPLFDLSEEALFAIAHDRGSMTLFESLEVAAATDDALAGIHATLSRWRERAAALPVFEFYASILSGEGGREKLIGRLGPETPDMLDEFMRYALAQERAGLPALQNFVSVLEAASPVIKREMDPSQNQVRIMTVHGAKGLEAPVVFLVDRGSAPHNSRHADGFLEIPVEDGEPVILWNAVSKLKSPVSEAARAEIARKAEEEYRRLLYVGMTRAADRLIVAGYAGVNGGGDNTWHAVVERALAPESVPVAYPDFEALRFQVTTAPPLSVEERKTESAQTVPLPSWFRSRVPSEPPLPRPLAPSGASGIAVERERDTAETAGAPSLLAGAADDSPSLAVRRGIVLHRLLQMLPSVPTGERRRKAAEYCHRFDHRWDAEDIADIVGQAFAILEDPAHAPLFGDNTAAEVPVMGTLTIGGEERAVSGVIDRIAVTDDRVLLVDYKTNAHPPSGPRQVPDVYLRQMALYRALVAPLYPDRPVDAYLLYTAGPRMIALPGELLDAALDSLAPS
ncbi:double-strand break repair helicase AddA [Oricola thermophila]|uniref:DNA 3'-5' helicase n=1 Tax=Oricola thermophila TaxID=2742145 RepID=A0A6N1VJ80_9HYPH|nr:double-strand break repair helicase AddA [Oricola thermophila]QKV19795.1 double-strand break repair helicase AddA [Oricola thermophila]